MKTKDETISYETMRVQESTNRQRVNWRIKWPTTVKHKHINGVVPYVSVGGECGVRFRSDEGDDAVTGTVSPTVASSGIYNFVVTLKIRCQGLYKYFS